MPAHRIAIITDSTCDIPAEWREKYQIAVVPLTIIFGSQQYLDGVELSSGEFYRRLPDDPNHPSTSQPSPKMFLEAYRKVASEGAEEIIVFTISSAMSGTVESARQAAGESPVPVHVTDGKNNSMGLGWQVVAAARVRDAGGDVEAILETAAQVRRNMVYYVTLDTMEYLVRGGRIGGATKFLTSVLHIKPLISVNPATGGVLPSIPARSRQKAIDGLYHEFFNHIEKSQPMHIAILHNAAEDEALQLAERVKNEFNPEELFVTITSPVLGAHTGPKALALCGYASESKMPQMDTDGHR